MSHARSHADHRDEKDAIELAHLRSLESHSGEPPLRKRRGFGRPRLLVVIGTALSLLALAGFIVIPFLYKALG